MTSRIPQQVIPLTLILIAIIVAFFVARAYLVPDSFGKYGHYRADAVDEIAALEIVYAGSQACADCHDDIQDVKSESHHRGVACETCHGPGTQHIEDPDEFVLTAPRGRGYCPLCHGYDPARPSGFPQILPVTHNPGKPCMTCHDPHNPELPHPPEECSACHRLIASEKMVSHHASLECTTCHETPAEHLITPAVALAKRPVSRQLCGQCHGEDAESSSRIPRVDLETHGEGYLCWDCHYPHYPEAGR